MRGRWVVAATVLALLVLPTATAGTSGDLLITGYAVDLPGSDLDDAVELANPTGVTVDLAAWSLTDGEGTVRFPDGAVLPPGGRIVVAGNGTAWQLVTGQAPDFAIDGTADVRVSADGSFLLNRQGDEILLSHEDITIDAVAFGKSDGAEGWAGDPARLFGSPFLRWYSRGMTDDAWSDTHGPADWERPKRGFVGATDFPVQSFNVTGDAVVYVAPDSSRATVRALLRSAQSSILLNVYDLADGAVAQDLVEAAEAGLDVRVLLDEQPVGFDPEERRVRNGLLSLLNESGASTHLATHGRISFNHAKYAVVDGAVTMVQSENLVRTGIPVDVRDGNRGWGILVEDAALAAYMGTVFTTDHAVGPWRAAPWSLGPDEASQPPPVQETRAFGVPEHDASRIAGHLTVTPVIAPDHTGGGDDPVLAALRAANESIRVNQLQLPPVWADASGAVWPNAYVEALEDAAARGVTVRVLVDGHFLDDPPASGGNEATIARLNGAGLANLEARVWSQDQFGVLHVKGVVVDGRTTLVGSMNWNLHSVTRNREVSLLVEGQGAAGYFADVFDTDWDRADPEALPKPLGAPAPSALVSAIVITCSLSLAAIAWRRHP